MTFIRFLLFMAVLLTPLSQGRAAQDAAADPNKVYRDNRSLQVLCKQTAAHIPWDDVTYQGGLDAKGNFIVAADIGVPFSAMDYPISIPLQLDILEKFDMDVPIGIIADATIAGIKVHRDGTVQYNGQDVTQPVGVFCRDHMADPALLEKARLEAEEAAKKAEASKGSQEAQDPQDLKTPKTPKTSVEREDLGPPIAGEGH